MIHQYRCIDSWAFTEQRVSVDDGERPEDLRGDVTCDPRVWR